MLLSGNKWVWYGFACETPEFTNGRKLYCTGVTGESEKTAETSSVGGDENEAAEEQKREQDKVIESKEPVLLDLAIERIQQEARAKFVETVELHVKLATDPKRSDHLVRGSAVLPHGTGKKTRIAVFASDFDLEKAKDAGADVVGGKELIDAIRESKGSSIDFDQAIATPAMMSSLATIARILGPKGLMPNPKKGTVTDDVASTIGEFRKGRVDFRQDKGAVIHAGLGKVDLPKSAILENVAALFGAIMLARPKGVKGSGAQGFIKSITMCSTMGRSVRVSVQDLLNASVKARKA